MNYQTRNYCRIAANAIRLLVVAALLAAQLGAPAAPLHASPADGQCTWKGTASSSWFVSDNWDCPNGGIPDEYSDAIINNRPPAVPNSPFLSGNASVKNIEMNGADLYVAVAAELKGETLTSNDSNIQNNGTINMVLSASTGKTQTGGTYKKSITVGPLAELMVRWGTLMPEADVTNAGTISGFDNAASILFKGQTLHNSGNIKVATTTFGKGGTQYMEGSGKWEGLSSISAANNTTVTLGNNTVISTGITIEGGSAVNILSNTLVMSGSVTYASLCTGSGNLLGNGKVRIEGNAVLDSCGLFQPTLEVAQGTAHASGNYSGTVHVLSGAQLMLHTGSLYVDANLTNEGTLTGTGSTYFRGNTFSNTGTVQMTNINFDRNGAQTLSGSGNWRLPGALNILSGSQTSLGTDVTVQNNLTVNGGGWLAPANHTLTLSGTLTLATQCTGGGLMKGSGTVAPRNDVSINTCTPFEPALHVITGTTQVAGVYSGTITVDKGAELTPLAGNFTAAGSLTNNGAITGTGTLNFGGPTFTNDGKVTIDTVNFTAISQTLKGKGAFVGDDVVIVAGKSVNLGSDHQVHKLTVNSGSKLDLRAHMLSVAAEDEPIVVNSGVISTTGSTINYDGQVTQAIVTAGVNYYNLIISNTQTATAPSGNLALSGDFTNTAGFDNNDGTLTFKGTRPQWVSGIDTTFNHFVVSNTAGVTLTTDITVSGDLTLNQHIYTVPYVLRQDGDSHGDYDVFGFVERTGVVSNTEYAFGSPYTTISLTVGQVPTRVVLGLLPLQPVGLPSALPRTYAFVTYGGGTYTATVRLHYRDGELNGAKESALQMFEPGSTPGSWVRRPRSAADTTQNWLELSGLHQPGSWGLAPFYQVFMPFVVR